MRIDSFISSLFRPLVKEVIIANTYQLKNINLQDNKTDKIDADKLARMLKLQFLGGEQLIAPVTAPPKEISDLRALFATYRIIRKQITQTKNRIHSLLKENLFPYTKQYIFGKKTRTLIRSLSDDQVLSFRINFLMDSLEQLEANFALLEEKILAAGAPFLRQIDILTSMSGISVITLSPLSPTSSTFPGLPTRRSLRPTCVALRRWKVLTARPSTNRPTRPGGSCPLPDYRGSANLRFECSLSGIKIHFCEFLYNFARSATNC